MYCKKSTVGLVASNSYVLRDRLRTEKRPCVQWPFIRRLCGVWCKPLRPAFGVLRSLQCDSVSQATCGQAISLEIVFG